MHFTEHCSVVMPLIKNSQYSIYLLMDLFIYSCSLKGGRLCLWCCLFECKCELNAVVCLWKCVWHLFNRMKCPFLSEKNEMTRKQGRHINALHLHTLVRRGYVQKQTGFVSSFHIVPLSIWLCYMVKIKKEIKSKKRASSYLSKWATPHHALLKL